MDGWTVTEVWNIDDKMIVGKTLEEAISTYKAYMGFGDNKEPKSIQRMYIGSPILGCDAIIKEDVSEPNLTKEQVTEVIRALKNYRQICASWHTKGCEHIAEQLLNRFIGKPDIQVSASDKSSEQ